uniref:Uncharacterized protein n=1 Tax=Glycine max TaxID=3847 RepID=C6SXF7_SOYBN|nr:unknown [Glycine max]
MKHWKRPCFSLKLYVFLVLVFDLLFSLCLSPLLLLILSNFRRERKKERREKPKQQNLRVRKLLGW